MARDHSSKIAAFLTLILLFSHVHIVGAGIFWSDSVVDPITSFLDKPVCDLPFGSSWPREIKLHHVIYLMENTLRISPNLPHSEYRGPSQLETGDVLVIEAGLTWNSYALVSNAEEGKAIFFADSNGLPVTDITASYTWILDKITLQEGSLDAAIEMGYGVKGVIHPQDSERMRERLLNAREIVGRKWHLFSFNSEHFATLAMTGSAKSPQMENIISNLKIAAYTGCLVASPTVPLDNCFGLVNSPSLKHLVKTLTAITTATQTKMLRVTTKLVSTTATQTKMLRVTTKLVSGAKYGFLAGIAIQGIVLPTKTYFNYQKMQSREISEAGFWRAVKEDSVLAGGSVIGSSIGGALGSALIPIPVVGTALGSAVGSFAGSYVIKYFY